MRKRIFSLLLSAAMVLSLLPASAIAAETTAVVVGSAAVQAGESVTIPVTLSEKIDFTNFEFTLDYDKEVFELSSINTKGALVYNGISLPSFDFLSGSVVSNAKSGIITAANATPIGINDDNLTLFTFTLTAKSTAVNGDHTIAITNQMVCLNGVDVPVSYETGIVTVSGGVDPSAQVPDITTQPEGAAYTVGAAAKPLTVEASVTDGGELSYQWYSCADANKGDAQPIEGATGNSYTPNTDAAGAYYYYCAVTNTVKGLTSTAYSAVVNINVSTIDANNAEVTLADGPYTYTGAAITPAVTVTLDGKTLSEGTDYTVSYKDNVNAGSAQAVVTFTGNYTGSVNKEFTIEKAAQVLTVPETANVCYGGTLDLSALVSGAQGDVTYALTSGEDFTLNGSTLSAPAVTGKTAKVTVSAAETDNYQASAAYTITVTTVDKVNVSDKLTFANGSATYTGGEQSYEKASVAAGYTGTITYTYAAQDGGQLGENGKPVNAGTYTVTATYEDAANQGTATATFTINPKAIGTGDFTVSTSAETYDGSAKTKEITSALAEADYTVNYSNNTNAGTATITITGQGNYTGSVTYDFTINKAARTITATSDLNLYLSGTAGQIEVTADDAAAENPTYTYTSSSAAIAEVSASGAVTPKGIGAAVITVTAPATANYQAAVATVKVNVTDLPAQKVEWNGDLTTSAVYGGASITGNTAVNSTEGGSAITYASSNSNVAAVDANTGVVTIKSAGTVTITATAAGVAGTWAETTVSYVLTVAPKAVELTWSGDENLTYDNTAKEVTAKVTNLLSGDECIVTVTGGSEVNAGSYTAAVSALSNSNYTLTGCGNTELAYTIAKAERTVSVDGTLTLAGSEGKALTVTYNSDLDNSAAAATTYDSSNSAVAAVSSAGVVTALDNGEAVITVTVAETANYTAAKAAITVTAIGRPITAVSVEGVSKKDDVSVVLNGSVITVSGQVSAWTDELTLTYTTYEDKTVTVKLPVSGSETIEVAGAAFTVALELTTIPTGIDEIKVVEEDGANVTADAESLTAAVEKALGAIDIDALLSETETAFGDDDAVVAEVSLNAAYDEDGSLSIEISYTVKAVLSGEEEVELTSGTVEELASPVTVTVPATGIVTSAGDQVIVTLPDGSKVLAKVAGSDEEGFTATFDTAVVGSFALTVDNRRADVTYHLEDGTVQTAAYTLVDIGTSLPTQGRSGYTFQGWALQENSSVVYSGALTEEMLTALAELEGEINLYPVFTRNSSSSSSSSRPSTSVVKPTEEELPGDEETPLDIRPMTDVPVTAWYYDAAVYVYKAGLMEGDENGQFLPDVKLTRAMLAQILYNKEGQPGAGTTRFADVAVTAWYADAVSWAADQGFITGYDNGMFGSEDNITREQMAVMLWRYAGSEIVTGSLEAPDAEAVSGYAVEAMRWAVANGVLSGDENGNLNPQGEASRAEVAQLFMNYMTLELKQA